MDAFLVEVLGALNCLGGVVHSIGDAERVACGSGGTAVCAVGDCVWVGGSRSGVAMVSVLALGIGALVAIEVLWAGFRVVRRIVKATMGV